MKIFLSLAFRNITRNKKRSLITLSAVTFGLASLIFLRGFVSGAQRQMVRNITETLTSDAQIVPPGLENIYNTNAYIENPEPLRQLLRSDRRILGFAEVVIAGGIVSSATNSMVTFLVAIDPKQEETVGRRRTIVHGRSLKPDDDYGATIGEKMRQVLDINIGDKIVFTSQDYYGALAGEAYTLVGTFESGNDQIDNGTVLLLKSSAQRLLSLGSRFTKIALKIDPREDLDKVVNDLRSHLLLPPDSGAPLQVLTWEELIPMLSQMMKFQNGMIFIVMLIVLTVVASGILNTLLMSTVERTREFGLMMAIGTKPRQVILLVALESLLLTSIGALLGVAIGIGLVLYAGHVGIDLSLFISAFSNFMIGSRVFPVIDWFYLFLFLCIVIGSNAIVSLYPAWRASRLEPIEAMRQVG